MLFRTFRCVALAALMATGGQAAPAMPQQAAKEIFGNTPLPSATEPRVHGFYSKGCIGGAVAIPVDGPTWQAMRLERNRRWGHPDLVALVQRLSREAVADGWPGLLVGDISQPRGGPMLSGHASHQIGLDADIWLTPMPDRRLTPAERRDTSAISVLKEGTLRVDPGVWTAAHGKLLARAASYGSVERLFVHPGIKQALCEAYGDNRANDPWMIKIRPYYGHHYHFHIRMRCPANSPGCRPQDPVPSSGNGCDQSLAWWFTDEPWKPAKPAPKPTTPVRKKVTTLDDLPSACRMVISDPQPADESLVTLTSGYDLQRAVATAVPFTPPVDGVVPLAKLPLPAGRPAR